MSLATREMMEHDSWRLYDYIVRHFIGTVFIDNSIRFFPLVHFPIFVQISADCKYKVTTLIFEIGSETFSVSGKTLLDAGFTRVMHWAALAPEEQMPDLKLNQLQSINDVRFNCMLYFSSQNFYQNAF